ncbi:MAG: hypothetical protein KME20_04605 [Kaiparowitsia implicata GSE-PSE-MK54-09C]|nr:hypothetical protein [Kaiparowitsia implicata GSE-PSE-MK54-09C]
MSLRIGRSLNYNPLFCGCQVEMPLDKRDERGVVAQGWSSTTAALPHRYSHIATK